MSEPIVELAGVAKRYPGGVEALRGVDLVIGRGEMTALVGPSGSGKSTLLHMVGTLDRPSEGTVRIAGPEVAELSDRKLSALRSRHIGFVFQQFHLAAGVSALDNVADGILYGGEGLRRRRERAAAALERVGLNGRPMTRWRTSARSWDAPSTRRGPRRWRVSRPSDALEAKAAAAGAFTNLLLGLGAVALLVGGVGVANTMVISVLERRREIGLRRSLGATRGQVRVQFLAESLLLSALGGAAGTLLGTGVTVAFALYRDWPPVVPPWALGGALAATLAIGTMAGLYPAMRAARLSPTMALATV